MASVIVSLAALHHPWPIQTVLSLEGNLTARDAYFSGSAADYSDSGSFFEAFLKKLSGMAEDDPILERYGQSVSEADPEALWQLGCDSAAFSQRFVPGDLLAVVPKTWYFYNPENCDPLSLTWLKTHDLQRTLLPGASHWPSIDQSEQLAEAILAALDVLQA